MPARMQQQLFSQSKSLQCAGIIFRPFVPFKIVLHHTMAIDSNYNCQQKIFGIMGFLFGSKIPVEENCRINYPANREEQLNTAYLLLSPLCPNSSENCCFVVALTGLKGPSLTLQKLL